MRRDEIRTSCARVLGSSSVATSRNFGWR